MKKRILITGAGGFIGKHLCGMLRECSDIFVTGLSTNNVGDNICDKYVRGDIRNAQSLGVDYSQFDVIYHLASRVSVPESYRQAQLYFDVNLMGTTSLIDAACSQGFKGLFLFCSTALLYASTDVVCNEASSVFPRGPYDLSKLLAERVLEYYAYKHDIRVVVARLTNIIGPGMASKAFLSEVLSQIVEIKHGKQPPILKVGQVDSSRDFVDVRDVCRAFVALDKPDNKFDIFNICSGKSVLLRDVISRAGEIAGVQFDVHSDVTKYGHREDKKVLLANDKLCSMTGWKPLINLDQSIEDVVNCASRKEQRDDVI